MKNTYRLIIALVLAFYGVAIAELTHVEDAATASWTEVNNTGRAYKVRAVATKVRADTSTTNTLTISVVNTQDTDLTGTNVTQTAITYDLKASGSYTGAWDWTADEDVIVPNGSTLKFTYTGSCTNDFLVFRSEVE